MSPEAVLFDFSGTLFRVEPAERWLRAVLDAAGIAADDAGIVRCAAALERAGALAGGAFPERVPEALEEVWLTRDRSMERHRAAYTGLARQVPLPWPDGVYDALYDRHMTPAAWEPYPDAAAVLRGLRERDVRVGVVSNIGWDLRPVFRTHGLDAYVDAYTLSFEHGVQKPDPLLFRAACEAVGHAPQDVLMVGDDRRADGGATALGCGFFPVDHLPAADRPDGLRPVLGLVG